MFSDQSCLPEIYLVADLNTCTDIPEEASVKKLAEVHEQGFGETIVDTDWSELPGKCLFIVKKNECESAVTEARNKNRDIRSCDNIRAAGFVRSFTSISFSGFSVLLSGSSCKGFINNGDHFHLLFMFQLSSE